MGMYLKTDKFEFKIGDTIAVSQIIKEGDKERLQIFEGIVVKIKKAGVTTFTVRRIGAGNVGVERVWPYNSPWIKKITVKRHSDIRRAKLYYLRDMKEKEGKRRTRED